jgi:hypothetical protein
LAETRGGIVMRTTLIDAYSHYRSTDSNFAAYMFTVGANASLAVHAQNANEKA